MAPKAEKKPVQPAKKSVAKKSSPGSRGRKKGSKKAVESYKIYIYKVYCKVLTKTQHKVARLSHFHLFPDVSL